MCQWKFLVLTYSAKVSASSVVRAGGRSFTASALKPEGVSRAGVLRSVAIVDSSACYGRLRMRTSDPSYRRESPQTSFASRVICALKSFDTGQFFSASPASRAKDSASILGTFARSVRADLLILKPCPSGSSVTAASVASSVGENPAPSSWKASAMVKHPACAAAISSSGFVPFSLSKRVLNEYGVAARTPESLDSSPLPVRPAPRQSALALRIMGPPPLPERHPTTRRVSSYLPVG